MPKTLPYATPRHTSLAPRVAMVLAAIDVFIAGFFVIIHSIPTPIFPEVVYIWLFIGTFGILVLNTLFSIVVVFIVNGRNRVLAVWALLCSSASLGALIIWFGYTATGFR